MFKNLGVQLFTIRDYIRDPESADAAFEKLAALGYTEAHTAGNDFDAKIFWFYHKLCQQQYECCDNRRVLRFNDSNCLFDDGRWYWRSVFWC